MSEKLFVPITGSRNPYQIWSLVPDNPIIPCICDNGTDKVIRSAARLTIVAAVAADRSRPYARNLSTKTSLEYESIERQLACYS